ncbi:hypothetical protein FRC12_004782 [Ceratobasidium sp. 428]|nr:hypothetical protein FRC12_004782 [Ceratobasidium sp. 428]
MTKCSYSPTSSISSQPSDSKDDLGPLHSSHDKKAPKSHVPLFNLELVSCRLDLLWRETEKLWKDKRGNTLPHIEDMAVRQKFEEGHSQAEDSSQESEWRELWKSTSASWPKFEGMNLNSLSNGRWAETHGSRNNDGHSHAVHSSSRDMTSTDDNKAMSTSMTALEQRMNDERHAQAVE